jgi:hypothetical protein
MHSTFIKMSIHKIIVKPPYKIKPLNLVPSLILFLDIQVYNLINPIKMDVIILMTQIKHIKIITIIIIIIIIIIIMIIIHLITILLDILVTFNQLSINKMVYTVNKNPVK